MMDRTEEYRINSIECKGRGRKLKNSANKESISLYNVDSNDANQNDKL